MFLSQRTTGTNKLKMDRKVSKQTETDKNRTKPPNSSILDGWICKATTKLSLFYQILCWPICFCSLPFPPLQHRIYHSCAFWCFFVFPWVSFKISVIAISSFIFSSFNLSISSRVCSRWPYGQNNYKKNELVLHLEDVRRTRQVSY